MSLAELKQRLIKKAEETHCYPQLGVRCIYEHRHSNTQIHFCLKSECTNEEFMLNSLRHWSSFVYASESEFLEDLAVCKFVDKDPREAHSYYEKVIGGLSLYEELLQKPPAFSKLGTIVRLVLISDTWNYQSLFMESDTVFICCHGDTAE